MASRPDATGERHWYACRTRARAEKKVELQMRGHGMHPYLPLLNHVREWADRRKRVSLPLFPGYLFVRSAVVDIPDVLRIPGVVKLADPNGYPTPVRESEMESVRRLVEGVNESGILPSPSDYLEPGQEVIVLEGPFKGLRGVLLQERGRSRVAVRITALRQATSVELDRAILRPAR